MKTARFSLLGILSIVMCGAPPADGGVPLTGSVQDQNGGVVLGAKLTLTIQETGAELKTKLDESGQFRFESVPAGKHMLKAKADGFETFETAVKVGDAEPKPIRIRMELKRQDEEVTVTSERAAGVALDPGENSNALKLDENLLVALPAEGQDVIGAVSRFLSPASQGAMGPSIVVDGVEGTALDVPAGSIKRIRVNKNPYSAQFRRPGNARVEVTTRDSRSNFHGGVAVFARESALDARNPLAATKPDRNKWLYQGRMTGPIRDTHLWYFVNFERLNDNDSAIVNALTLNGPVNSNFPTPSRQTNFLGRLDIRPNQMHSMNVRYMSVDTGKENRGVGGFRLPEASYSSGEREDNFQFADHRISNAGFNNDFRVQFDRDRENEGAAANLPSIVVKGAFTGGPSSNFSREIERTFRIENVTNYYRGKHRLQFGGQVRPRWLNSREQDDFNGVFEFSSLATFASNTPYVFRFTRGNPAASFTQHDAFDFIQDQVLLTPTLQLQAGVRHEWHDGPAKANHFAPRLGIAWAPGQARNTVVRAGAGFFYESFPKSIARRRLLYDGVRLLEFIVPSPACADRPQEPMVCPTDGASVAVPPSVVRVARDLTLPKLFQASAGIERSITGHVQVAAEYRMLRAVHIYRSRDINAPLPETGMRPDPSVFAITNVESSGSMRSNALETSVRWSGKVFAGMAQYTYSRSNDDAYGLFASPANPYDLRAEWGRADFDRRHVLNLLGSLNLPGRVRVGTITTIGSALPFNITTGADNNGDAVAADRPFGITRNTGSGGGLVQTDFRFTKLFEVRRLYKKPKKDFYNLELSVDLFNALNHTNYDRFVGVLNSPFFGRANAAQAGRTLQTSIRYNW